jgi:hypothetical protein
MDGKAHDIEVLTRRVEELQRGNHFHPNIQDYDPFIYFFGDNPIRLLVCHADQSSSH